MSVPFWPQMTLDTSQEPASKSQVECGSMLQQFLLLRHFYISLLLISRDVVFKIYLYP